MNEDWPWIALVLLGAYHGLNPAMGWLFSVALGMQERSRAAVLHALAPIALGHAASVAAVVALAVVGQALIDPGALRVGGAIALVGFALARGLGRLSHPRWVGMRVGFRDLVAWSFLMSTAHGAGLMLVPVLLRLPAGVAPHLASAAHADHALAGGAATTAAIIGLAATAVHAAAMVAVMGTAAVLVYEKIGVGILRRGWFNLDRVWIGALLAAGVLTLLL